ncbi:MAG: Maf family protein [Pontimonas sp.]
MQLFLASTSPARLHTLQQVGITPSVLDHAVDEQALVDAATAEGPLPTREIVQLLAKAKAHDAAGRASVTGLILGGDSLFELDGEIFGKPHTPERARQRWHRQRGKTGVLHSGHSLLHSQDGEIIAEVGVATHTSVTFVDDLSDDEIDAYIATGEPLKVAGAFTIDAKGAGFIESIEGDPYTVVGLSVAALRRLVRQLGFSYTDLWSA